MNNVLFLLAQNRETFVDVIYKYITRALKYARNPTHSLSISLIMKNMHVSNLLRLELNMLTFILANKRLFALTLLLPYLDKISICEHQYDITDDVIKASLSAYTAKANVSNVSNAYKCLKRVSV